MPRKELDRIYHERNSTAYTTRGTPQHKLREGLHRICHERNSTSLKRQGGDLISYKWVDPGQQLLAGTPLEGSVPSTRHQLSCRQTSHHAPICLLKRRRACKARAKRDTMQKNTKWENMKLGKHYIGKNIQFEKKTWNLKRKKKQQFWKNIKLEIH